MKPHALAATALAACSLVAAAAAAGSQTPPVLTFSITTTVTGDEQPAGVWVEQGPQRADLTRSGATYVGSMPGSGVVTVRSANLVAQYGPNQVTLPVRFVPGKPAMSFAVQNPPLLPCAHAAVSRLEAPGASYAAQLNAYYKARRLAQSGNCGETNQARVVRAWFDRSYTLADSNDHIGLDAEAASALKAIPLHRTYARIMEQRMTSRLAQLDYAYQMALATDGEYAAAAAVNAALITRLQSDETFANAVAQYQDLTVGQLRLDASVLDRQAAAVGPQ